MSEEDAQPRSGERALASDEVPIGRDGWLVWNASDGTYRRAAAAAEVLADGALSPDAGANLSSLGAAGLV